MKLYLKSNLTNFLPPVVGVHTEHLAKATARLVYIPDNLFNLQPNAQYYQ